MVGRITGGGEERLLSAEHLGQRFIRPERRFNAEFIDGLNDATEVMAENFTKNFVGLGGDGLASEPFAEFSLNHAKDRLDV